MTSCGMKIDEEFLFIKLEVKIRNCPSLNPKSFEAGLTFSRYPIPFFVKLKAKKLRKQFKYF